MSDESQKSVLETAKTAFNKFEKGWESGDFSEYLAMITDEFTFSFPTGEHRGVFTGKSGYEEMTAKCLDDAANGGPLKFNQPGTTAIDGKTVVFDFESEGDFGGNPYYGRNIIIMEIEGKKVCGFREYFGDLDPNYYGNPYCSK